MAGEVRIYPDGHTESNFPLQGAAEGLGRLEADTIAEKAAKWDDLKLQFTIDAAQKWATTKAGLWSSEMVKGIGLYVVRTISDGD